MNPTLIALSSVTHIGTLNPSDKGNRGPSYEGLGVSFSMHPQAWEQIARLGGNPWWEADVSSCHFLDAHTFMDENAEDIVAWGKGEGLVEQTTAYKISWYDDEMESEMEMLCKTLEEARQEVADFDESSDIEEVSGLAPTAKLVALMGASKTDVGKPYLSALSDITTIWARQSGLDGVWWEDVLDPDSYSAPRGVIFPESVSKLQFTEVSPQVSGNRRKFGM